LRSFDLANIKSESVSFLNAAADHYSKACGVACRVIDSLGSTCYIAAEPDQIRICDLTSVMLKEETTEKELQTACICDHAHLYGCYQAERFGGQYIYFCPLGLTHWAAPVYRDGSPIGALICGPVNMVDPEEFLLDDLVVKNGIHPDHLSQMHHAIQSVPVISTERVNAMSELLFYVADSLSDASFEQVKNRKESGDLQALLWDQIHFMKRFTHVSEENLAYPIEKEDELLQQIEMGNKAVSQKILNEIMGHIFFSSSGSIEIMRARVLELVVLLSRAAIRGGADVQQIFGLNYTYLSKIQSFQNIDEIAYWLSGIMTRFTDQVFNLTHVKHADVIFHAISFIKKNYMKKITLEQAASHVYLSPAYFSRLFKLEMGENFNTYVNSIRVQSAKNLLMNEAIPMIDIASLVGFETQSYFSKVFKRLTGVTPGKYRESRGQIKPENNSVTK
jgi:AraC-like DNA-binding protein/ligand-binding sensor protein